MSVVSSRKQRSNKPPSKRVLTEWGDRLGRWNPQLLRELRGRLNRKSVTVAIAISLGLQLLVGYVLFEPVYPLIFPDSPPPAEVTLPAPDAAPADQPFSHRLCTGPAPPHHINIKGPPVQICLPDGQGAYQVNWQKLCNTALPWIRGFWGMGMAIAGSTAIAQDWEKEAKLGTLNFLRLSPEPAGRLLLGKVLGTPILYFVGSLAALPMYLYLSANAEGGLLGGFLVDGVSMSVLALVLTGTLTLAVLAERAQVVFASLMLVFLSLVLGVMLVGTAVVFGESGGLAWFGLNLTQSTMVPLIWGSAIALTLTALLWNVARRRFKSPGVAALSRLQAYQWMGVYNLIGLGFLLPVIETLSRRDTSIWVGFSIVWFILQSLILWGTMPNRQQLLDWQHDQEAQLERVQTSALATGQSEKGHVYRSKVGPWQRIWDSASPPHWVPTVGLLMTWLLCSPWAIALLQTGEIFGISSLLSLIPGTIMLTLLGSFSLWLNLKNPRAHRFWMGIVLSLYGLGWFSSVILLAFSK